MTLILSNQGIDAQLTMDEPIQVLEDAVEIFNGDIKVCTCGPCGTVHLHAYSVFPWTDNDEQRKTGEIW